LRLPRLLDFGGQEQMMPEDTSLDDKAKIAHLPPSGITWNTLVFLVVFYGIAVIIGVRNIWQSKPLPVDLLIPLAFSFCLAVWALEDARHRKYRIPDLSKAWFFLLAIPVVPGYVIWSRGWRGLGWVSLHAFCWLLLGLVTRFIGGTIVFGDEWWRPMGRK
jgi:hypothetical protein